MIFDYSKFPYNNDNIIEIFSINNKLNIYLRDNIEEVLKDYSNPYLEPFKPKGGYEFTDKSNYNEGIGIYHSHLTKLEGKLWVLIWYFKENKNNYYDIIFELIIHPTDDYNQVLNDIKNDIKNDNLTINPNNWKNFSEKLRIIRFNDIAYLQSQ